MVKPFVKWPGGKTGELEIIHQFLPTSMNNYIEPFLGGGACFLSIPKEKYHQAYVNDFSGELIALYTLIRERNELFNRYLHDIWDVWSFFGMLSNDYYETLRSYYGRYKSDEIEKEQLKELIDEFIEIKRNEVAIGVQNSLDINFERLIKELKKSILSKFTNTKNNEIKKGDLPEEDYRKNFESSIRASVYTYYRYLYNERVKYNLDQEMHIALFFYLREFCYSSMFRYNKSGGFNVPYGGASYNSKAFNHKIDYLWSTDLQNILRHTNIYNADFQEFLQEIPNHEEDFIFLDPPYDSDFSTYANHSFVSKDQERLANYLINHCNCRFMLIIKNTDFIYNLYNQPGINIIGFDKEYSVSFMDRNDRKVEHILITNYKR
ncbi:DNA adenine methylase [Alkalihalobacterium chitinilyticum]|uniref:site-specific DNA-methyltransferase (adenine-specific) n=1 Tax=Alkalihalobacterium chitinilyticum TaxID=2980103 RepID=A0ABT5V8K9_9BACI|nr:DNA adenine methylase [Alkalihalobacterium chitinilyticum]MDE5411775.1 DNA adenine methylase [Alkalihalobacterium chitinilyticum]